MIRRRPAYFLCFALACLALAGCRRPDQALIGGPFHLVDQDGHPRDQSLLKGKWSAVYFGYTFCPDVCPTTLQTLADAEGKMGSKARRLQVVFITVDPERDTPAQLKTYLSSQAFPKGTIGLTGTPAQIAVAAKAYKVFYQKQGTGQDYEVQHVSAVYLMNPDGGFDRPIGSGLTPDQEAKQISDAMGGA
jgi:protein SCO1/2